MTEAEKRLGDLIDDYCPRCRLLLNHAVASIVEGEVVKVICQTCYSEHPYRHEKGGKKKSASRRSALFQQVLAKTGPERPKPGAGMRKRKAVAPPARYISRHKTRPPRGNL